MLFAFFYPRRQAVKARHVGHVIHEDHGVHVSVIVLDHAFSESLLSRRVPQLDLEVGKRREKLTISSSYTHRKFHYLRTALCAASLILLCSLLKCPFGVIYVI